MVILPFFHVAYHSLEMWQWVSAITVNAFNDWIFWYSLIGSEETDLRESREDDCTALSRRFPSHFWLNCLSSTLVLVPRSASSTAPTSWSIPWLCRRKQEAYRCGSGAEDKEAWGGTEILSHGLFKLPMSYFLDQIFGTILVTKHIRGTNFERFFLFRSLDKNGTKCVWVWNLSILATVYHSNSLS